MCVSKWSSPHGAKVPAPYGCVIRCGELAAVVVGAPLARSKLELTFALQGGSAGDLQRTEMPSLWQGCEFHPNTCDRFSQYPAFNKHKKHYKKSFFCKPHSKLQPLSMSL